MAREKASAIPHVLQVYKGSVQHVAGAAYFAKRRQEQWDKDYGAAADRGGQAAQSGGATDPGTHHWHPSHSSVPQNLAAAYAEVTGADSRTTVAATERAAGAGAAGGGQHGWGKRWSPKARQDWKPYNPYKSLASQETHFGNHAAHAVLKGAPQVSQVDGYVPYQPVEGPPGVGGRRDPSEEGRDSGGGGGGDGKCSEENYWAIHPEECLRQVYGGNVAGTKFARIGEVSKSASSDASLAEERRAIASKVTEGMLNGAVKVGWGLRVEG
jgi:hypothetical protein